MTMEFIRIYQMDIMLALGSICGITAVFTHITKSLSPRRKRALIFLELSAMILLFSDRCAYLVQGDTSPAGYYLVRISNFLVFFMTLMMSLGLNLYLRDLLLSEIGLKEVPERLKACTILVAAGELLIIVSQFTGLYYTFDAANNYQRAPGFVISYMIPLMVFVLQLSTVARYYKRLRKKVRIPLALVTIVPIASSVVQIFTYGISVTNIVLVGAVILLYVFALIDMNETVEKANALQIEFLQAQQESMQRLFDQTATAFVTAIDAKDVYSQGHSVRVAEQARRIARACGRDEETCREVYYAGLLHDVGRIGIPDQILRQREGLTEEEYEQMKKKPLIGDQILSNISEYPYLRLAAHFSYERYDGTGYPEGLKGEEIPEIARIIAVADAYDAMTNPKRYRDALPTRKVREELIEGQGTQFDPVFAQTMVRLIDEDHENRLQGRTVRAEDEVKQGLVCQAYRGNITRGLPVTEQPLKLRLQCRPLQENLEENSGGFSAPSMILFTSLDGCVHDSEKTIREYRYQEYGEIWFDGHAICTAARDMRVEPWSGDEGREKAADGSGSSAADAGGIAGDEAAYEVTAEKFRDHIRLRTRHGNQACEIIFALTSISGDAYLALTGENCRILQTEIFREQDGVGENGIPRIAEEITYTNRLEGDLPNLQIESRQSAATEGIEIRDGMKIEFHTMSLPSASMVWHCPYILLFSSDNRRVNGPGYREYALIKLNGECTGKDEHTENKLIMNREESFKGWDHWKRRSQEGMECRVSFARRGNRITVTTENLGVSIHNVTTIKNPGRQVLVALTGDQCALTDIRVH